MLSTFTELNRKRPKAELFDFITHTTCSIVHAAGRSFGDGDARNPSRDHRLDQSHDRREALSHRPERHRGAHEPLRQGRRSTIPTNGAFASPTTILASAACSMLPGRLAMSPPAPMAELDARRDGRRVPGRLGSFTTVRPTIRSPISISLDGHAVYPAFHVMAGLATGCGRHLIETRSSEPRRATGACVARRRARSVLWLANLTAEPADSSRGRPRRRAPASEHPRRIRVRASRRLAGRAGRAEAPARGAELNLDAYAVARVEVRTTTAP